MKRFIFFITTALLIAAAGFADRGYGKIKWEPMSHLEFLNYNYGEGWEVWGKEESPTEKKQNSESNEEKHDNIITFYLAEKLDEHVLVYVVYKTTETKLTTYYTPEAVIYFLSNEKKEELYESLANTNLICRRQRETSKELKEENYKLLNDDYKFQIENIALEEKREISRLKKNDILPYDENKANYSVYEYNEDTYMSIYDNFLENQMIIIYTYHEPDY